MPRTLATSKATDELRERRPVNAVLRGLQFKWTALLTLIMFALAVLGDVLMRDNIQRLTLENQTSNANKYCAAISKAASRSLRYRDVEQLERIADQFHRDSAILYIEFYDGDGVVLVPAHSRSTVQPTTISSIANLQQRPIIHATPNELPSYLDYVYGIQERYPDENSAKPATFGFVRIGLDLSDVDARVSAFVEKVRYAGMVSILMMIPLAFMLVQRITAPINALSRAVKLLAAGDFRVRSDIRRSDEIGELASSFNSMADELARSNDGLVKLNAELEDRVLQRTRQLKELASRDPLTNLYNRRHLNEVMVRRFAEAERYGSDLACLMIDLDNFKQINDRYGHESGDNLLILTAEVISSELRGADVGARFGGDEFCVLLPQSSAEQAEQVGQRIVQRFQIEIKNRLPEGEHNLGMSIGVAGIQELKLMHPDELMKASDQALYSAKQAGKNRIHLAESLA